MPVHHRRLAFHLFIVALSMIAIGILMPGVSPPEGGVDKILHVLSFALLGLLGRLSSAGRRTAFAIAIVLVAVSGLLEIIQALQPLRSASWLDFSTNTIGVAAGYTVAHRLAPWLSAVLRK